MWHGNCNTLSKVMLVAHRRWFLFMWLLALVLYINTTTATNAAIRAVENVDASRFKMRTNATMDRGNNDTESRDFHKLETNLKELLGRAFILMKQAGRDTNTVNFLDLAEATAQLSHETAEAKKTIMQNTYRNLKAHYGDLTVAYFIAAAKSRHDIASELERCQLDDWASQGLKLQQVFSLLNINSANGNALLNPLLLTCLAYAKKIESVTSTDLIFFYNSLRRRFTDLAFANMVSSLDITDHSILNELALNMRHMLMDELRNDDPVDLFHRLFKEVDMGNIIRNSAILIWLELAWSHNVDPYQVLLLELITSRDAHYVDIAKIAAAPYEGEGIRAVALNLEMALAHHWYKEDLKDEAVFAILGLDKLTETDVIKSPFCETWFYYYYLKNFYSSVGNIKMLKSYFKDDIFVLILFASVKRNDDLENAVYPLMEEALISKNIDPVQLFRIFCLDEARGQLFENLFFKFWAKYVKSVYPDVNPAKIMVNIMVNAGYSINTLEEIIGRVIHASSRELESSVPLLRNAEFAPDLWAVVLEAKQKQ